MNWAQILNQIFVIVLLWNSFIVYSWSFDNHDFSSYEAKYLPNCDYETNDQKNYFIAITLNGRINIIDAVLGKIKWSKQIQSDPLISSNIGDVMKIRNSKGESIQILPSLDGNLYVYQEDQIKKTQFSAEKLLKSSFKFNENILLVGGQESKVIGLNLNSGDLIYDCGHAGCSNENYSIDGDIVLLRKNSQSVRAINTMTGQEEWHFVVDDPQVIKVSNQECSSNSTSPYSITFKVMLPTGQITSLVHYTNDSLQSEIFNSWNLILDSPIVNMWHLINEDLVKINLFDPNINSFETLIPKNSVRPSYFYLGSFNNNFYIQTAEDQTEENQLIPYINNDNKDKNYVIKQDFIPLQTKQSNNNLQTENKNTQLMRIGGNFPFMKYESINATGYLVLQNKLNHNDVDEKCSSTEVVPEYTPESVYVITEIVYISITYYWKEILCLCLIFSAAINTLWCLVRKWFRNLFKKGINTNNCNRSCFDEDDNTIELNPSIVQDNRLNGQQNDNQQQQQQQKYSSRFLEDFEPLSLLGKGGFGMVFEAKHKIDESHYAVKRIRIPTNEEKRLRFTREIRALSKLDHVNIVRYYNAWLEEPPMGWQEKQDELKNFELTSTFDATTYTPKSQDIKRLESFDNKIQKSQTDNSLEIVFKECSNEQIKQVSTKNDKLKNVSKTSDDDDDDDVVDENVANNSIESEDLQRKTYYDKNKSNHFPIPKAYMYIQMQLCKKETLKDWLQKNLQRNNQHVIDIFVQILKGVNYVHSNNLIHRDLKPSNIFFSMDGLIKIGDFGLVTTDNKHDTDNRNDQVSNSPLPNKNFKHTNRVGTQLYMSPEQIKNKPYDHKVDIYSLGIILYELLIPFQTESERIIQLQNARIRKFSDILLKKYSKEKTIIETMMAESPKDRPESHDILTYDLFCAN